MKEAALAQNALKVIVDLVAEPLARHPRMSEKVNFVNLSALVCSKLGLPHQPIPALTRPF